MPRVSVIIPTYNRAALVTEAIDSVLQQTYRDFEVIVVDDGSTDDTKARLHQYGDRIVHIEQPNAGINAARNRGIAAARGEYIALLDNDDLWLDFKLALQVATLDRLPEIGFVFSDFFILRSSGERTPRGLDTWHTHGKPWDELFRREIPAADVAHALDPSIREMVFRIFVGDVYPLSAAEPWVLPSATLFRRSCLAVDIRLPEDDPTCGDWEFFSRMSKRHSCALIALETTCNRSHKDAVRLTRLPKEIQIDRHIRMIRRLWKSDAAFYATHRQWLEGIEHRLLVRLALLHALASNPVSVRTALHESRTLTAAEPSLRTRLIATALKLPAGSALLRLAYRLAKRVGFTP